MKKRGARCATIMLTRTEIDIIIASKLHLETLERNINSHERSLSLMKYTSLLKPVAGLALCLSLASCASQQSKWDMCMNTAKTAIDKGQYELAEEAFTS